VRPSKVTLPKGKVRLPTIMAFWGELLILGGVPPTTNIGPEKMMVENDFPFEMVPS